MKLHDMVQFKEDANVSGDLVGRTFKVIEMGKLNARLRGKDAYNRQRTFLARQSALVIVEEA